jgi:hypothetical protein
MRTPNCPDSAPSSPHFHACHFLLLSGYPTIRPSEPNHTPPGTRTKPIKEPASRCGLVHRAVYSIRRRRPDFCSRGLSAPPNRVNLFQSQQSVSAESITYALNPAPALYTVDRGAIPLCSVSEIAFVPYLAWRSRNPAIRVTHLAKKPLPMRHPFSRRHLNSLKKRSLKPHNYELHTRSRCVTRPLCYPPPGTRNPRTETPAGCCSSPRTSRT